MASEKRQRYRFPKRSRISRQQGFAFLLKQKPLVGHWFMIYTSPNGLGYARVGITVAKRLVPKAVKRNRIKRDIKESFRCRFQASHDNDVIVRLRRPIEQLQHPQAYSELCELLNKALATK